MDFEVEPGDVKAGQLWLYECHMAGQHRVRDLLLVLERCRGFQRMGWMCYVSPMRGPKTKHRFEFFGVHELSRFGTLVSDAP